MTMPFDGWSLAVIGAAGALLFGASRQMVPQWSRVACIVAAAFLIRLDPSWQMSLHDWDEAVHAVVARHLVSHPLTPTLYEQPLPAMSPEYNWTSAGIWLHKPPLALWLMAASLAGFGFHALALRLPSVLLSTGSVLLTYFIGRRVFDARAGLLGAGFQTVNGLLVTLASGRRVADHVDTALLFCVELGILAVVSGLDEQRSKRHSWLAGVALGLGLLAKSFPALLIAVVAVVAWLHRFGFRCTVLLAVRLSAAALAVAGPWFVYTSTAFPDVARATMAFTLRHVTEVIEGSGGPIWAYVREMPRMFGELIYVPVVAFLWSMTRRPATSGEWAIAASMVVPYVTFSLMSTKLAGFIAIAAPALFLAQAVVWLRWRDRVKLSRSTAAGAAMWILLALLLALPARLLLEPTGPFERRDRATAAARHFRQLHHELGPGEAVVFNVPRHFELTFYSGYAAYDRLPFESEVDLLQRRNVRIVVYQTERNPVAVPEHWRATIVRERTSPPIP